jgi:hypothetical protein
VTCPNEVTLTIRRGRDGAGTAHFAAACATCPLAAQCTTSTSGWTIGADFTLLAAATNLARLAVLGLRSTTSGWATTTA